MRSAKVMANALSAGFHRIVHRFCPVPVAGPEGYRSDEVGRTLEASAQRPGNHVRRSYARSRRTLTHRAIGKPPLTPNIGQTRSDAGEDVRAPSLSAARRGPGVPGESSVHVGAVWATEKGLGLGWPSPFFGAVDLLALGQGKNLGNLHLVVRGTDVGYAMLAISSGRSSSAC